MHYSIKKFKMEHFKKFDARDEQKLEIEFLFKNEKVQRIWMFELPVFTLFFDKTPIMIYALQNSGMGTYYPMVFFVFYIDKHRFAVIRCLYDYVEKFVGTDVRRFEAYVTATDSQANRLARFFGFEPVGIRRQAAIDGQDQIIYERLWRK